ncbi:MAG: general secretion pathway protein GspK [Kiritimatiellae bacterium]|nr:general secretion pathway protein GspK [Kiritimatiellia bacterium]
MNGPANFSAASPASRGGAARASYERGRGSALVLVLLVVAVLSTLVGSLGFEARLESRFARYLRHRAVAGAAAESGIEVAKMLMARAGGRPAASDLDEDEDRWHDAAERLAKGQAIIGLVEPVGDAFVAVDIEPEPGRLNVNLLTRDDWETILGNAGIPEEYFDYIIDPVLDWMDEDDTPNPKGAETEDYYELLDPPRKARNGPFDTVRELLLVKGFPEALLAGGAFDPAVLEGDPDAGGAAPRFNRFSETNDLVIAGIEDMLTTYGDGKVNIQSAPYDVLRTLPDVDDILARAIMEEREALDDEGDPDPFKSVDDLFARIDGLSGAVADRVTVNSQFYRITATGRSGDVERQISCVAYADGEALRILRWREDP